MKKFKFRILEIFRNKFRSPSPDRDDLLKIFFSRWCCPIQGKLQCIWNSRSEPDCNCLLLKCGRIPPARTTACKKFWNFKKSRERRRVRVELLSRITEQELVIWFRTDYANRCDPFAMALDQLSRRLQVEVQELAGSWLLHIVHWVILSESYVLLSILSEFNQYESCSPLGGNVG